MSKALKYDTNGNVREKVLWIKELANFIQRKPYHSPSEREWLAWADMRLFQLNLIS